MKARSDENTKPRNNQSRVSAKKSSGEQQSAGRGQHGVRANQQDNGPRGRESSSIRGRESGQVRGEDAGASDHEQGISNRGSRQEVQRQQKVAPGRAKTKSARSTNQRRAG
jgi:hypothetical protein